MPLVTVVTVTFDAERYLEQTIRSVLAQDYPNIEYIIIDGGSSDKTVEIIKRYSNDIATWLSETDEGIYDAMNKGVDLAHGEWINFMNAGDEFASDDAVTYMLQQVEKETDIIMGDRFSIYEGTGRKVFNKAPGIKGILDYGMPAGHQSMLIGASLMKAYKYSTHYKYAADHAFILRCHQDNRRFQFVDKAISNYLRGGLSDTKNLDVRIEILFIHMRYRPSNTAIVDTTMYQDLFNTYPPQGKEEEYAFRFSMQFNRLYDQYIQILGQYEKIVLYGNGKIAQTLLGLSTKNVIAVLDVNDEVARSSEVPVYDPSRLDTLDYDVLLVTVLGREMSVIEHLLKSTSIAEESIVTFKLIGDQLFLPQR